MTMRDEMDWEDSMGFPRATRQPYHCIVCGKTFQTRSVYVSHVCNPQKRTVANEDAEHTRLLQESLKNFKRKHGIK